MSFIRLFLGLLSIACLLAACSVQRTYFESEIAVALDLERQGATVEAHKALISALWRAKNHLEAKDVSSAYYNLGTFLRRQGRFKDSIAALSESVKVAQATGAFDDLAMGRRYAELAGSYAGAGAWNDGVQYLKLIVPFWERYTGREGLFVVAVFQEYDRALRELGLPSDFIPNQALQRTLKPDIRLIPQKNVRPNR